MGRIYRRLPNPSFRDQQTATILLRTAITASLQSSASTEPGGKKEKRSAKEKMKIRFKVGTECHEFQQIMLISKIKDKTHKTVVPKHIKQTCLVHIESKVFT